MKNFEWDENKRKLNLEKHGIDFIDAIEIFDEPDRIERLSHRKGEERIQTIGMVYDVVISLAYIVRQDKKRVISVRRARKNE